MENENKIEIETVSIDDVLKNYSVANSYAKYLKFNPPVEFDIEFKPQETPEEIIERLNKICREGDIDAFVEAMQEEGLYITNISYSFPGFDDLLPDKNTAFTENITMVGKIGGEA